MVGISKESFVLINKSEYFVQAAELAKNGKYHEAQRAVESELTSKWTQAYMPVGDIIISMEHKGEAKDYERGLDIHDAVSYVKYTVDGVNYRRETISSAPDNVIAINISGDKEKSVSFGITFESLLPSEVSAKGDTLQLKGQTPSHVEPSYSNDLEEPVQYYEDDAERGMLFAAMAKVKTQGGSVSASGMEIKVSNADSATIYIDIRTSFSDYNTHPFLNPAEYEKPCLENVKKVSEKPFCKYTAKSH